MLLRVCIQSLPDSPNPSPELAQLNSLSFQGVRAPRFTPPSLHPVLQRMATFAGEAGPRLASRRCSSGVNWNMYRTRRSAWSFW